MTLRTAGCDLGKTSLSYAVGSVGEDGRLALEHSGGLPHEGQPLAMFARWYGEHSIGRCDALGATGVYSSELLRPTVGLPEDGCQEAALGWAGAPPSLNLVSVGGRGYSVLTSRPAGRAPAGGDGPGGPAWEVRFVENDENEKCSSGIGENIQRIAARFGLDLAEADAIALGAALDGRLAKVEFDRDPVFGFDVPTQCPDVPATVLDPASSWHDRTAYMQRYRQLASRFVENFKKFEAGCPPEVVKAGPTL